MITDKEGNVRFEEGSQKCVTCGTKKNILQLERETKIKGLPVKEIKFFCKTCAKELLGIEQNG